MLAPLLLLWPMSVVLTWLVAQGIANKPFDRELGDKARLLSQHLTVQTWADGAPHLVFSLPADAAELLHADESDTLFYQVVGPEGEFLGGDRMLPAPPESQEPPTP
ncbi:MAG: sensor histidine kinase N-terminal domain-containing protein, partial [Rhizobacter sp.]